jgi:hypothetical protein
MTSQVTTVTKVIEVEVLKTIVYSSNLALALKQFMVPVVWGACAVAADDRFVCRCYDCVAADRRARSIQMLHWSSRPPVVDVDLYVCIDVIRTYHAENVRLSGWWVVGQTFFTTVFPVLLLMGNLKDGM